MLQSSSGLFTEVEEDQGDGGQAITRNRNTKHENNRAKSCDNEYLFSGTWSCVDWACSPWGSKCMPSIGLTSGGLSRFMCVTWYHVTWYCDVLWQVCAVQPAQPGPRLRLPVGGDDPAAGQGRQHHRGHGAGDQSESSILSPDQSESSILSADQSQLTWPHSHHLNQLQVTGEEDEGSLDQTIAAVREVMEETDYFRWGLEWW